MLVSVKNKYSGGLTRVAKGMAFSAILFAVMILKKFCMFASDKRFRRNPKTIYFNDKELPVMGRKSERLVLPFLERLSNPKTVAPHTNIFSMDKKKQFVAVDTECVQVTPAQQKLLKLITHVEAEDYFTSLKQVHYLGTYCVDKDMVELWQHGYVHQLLDAIQEIKQEHFINNLKTA